MDETQVSEQWTTVNIAMNLGVPEQRESFLKCRMIQFLNESSLEVIYVVPLFLVCWQNCVDNNRC